jgi:hypothetical protein
VLGDRSHWSGCTWSSCKCLKYRGCIGGAREVKKYNLCNVQADHKEIDSLARSLNTLPSPSPSYFYRLPRASLPLIPPSWALLSNPEVGGPESGPLIPMAYSDCVVRRVAVHRRLGSLRERVCTHHSTFMCHVAYVVQSLHRVSTWSYYLTLTTFVVTGREQNDINTIRGFQMPPICWTVYSKKSWLVNLRG